MRESTSRPGTRQSPLIPKFDQRLPNLAGASCEAGALITRSR